MFTPLEMQLITNINNNVETILENKSLSQHRIDALRRIEKGTKLIDFYIDKAKAEMKISAAELNTLRKILMGG